MIRKITYIMGLFVSFNPVLHILSVSPYLIILSREFHCLDEDNLSELLAETLLVDGILYIWIFKIYLDTFYTKIPAKARLSGVTIKSVFNSKFDESVP